MRHMLPVVLAALSSLGAGLALGGNVLSKVDAELYGYIKLDAVYDTQKTYVGDIMLFVRPEGTDEDDEFTMTARESRFGFKISGPDLPGKGKATARVEADFYGGGDADPANRTRLYLRLAYLDLAWNDFSIRAGQDWDTFIAVVPKSLNFTYFGHQGSPGYRRPQLRVTQAVNAGPVKVTAKIAAHRQEIGADLDRNGQDDGEDSGAPGVQGSLTVETKLLTDKTTRLSISGLWAQETVDLAFNGTNRVVDLDGTDFEASMIMGSIYVPLHKMVALQGAYWQGMNLDAYECFTYQGVNMALGEEVRGSGGWAQIVIDPTPKLNINLGYGVDDPKDDDLVGYAGAGGTAGISPRLKNEFFVGSVMYKLNDVVTLALELSDIRTDYKKEGTAEDFRTHAAAFYYF